MVKTKNALGCVDFETILESYVIGFRIVIRVGCGMGNTVGNVNRMMIEMSNVMSMSPLLDRLRAERNRYESLLVGNRMQ